MTPRDYALQDLDSKSLPNWPAGKPRRNRAIPPVQSARNSRPRPHDLRPPTDPRDLALAEQITVGVIKNLLLLQHLIQHYSGRAPKSIDPIVQKILAIGLYQLRFLTRIPESAAVDQAVEQSKRFGQPRAAGFVNAVLRKATRDPAPPLPDESAAADHARLALSHPHDLFKRLGDLLGQADALRFCRHDQLEPPTILRLDDPAGFLAQYTPESLAIPRNNDGFPTAPLTINDITLTPHASAGMYVVTGAKRAALAEWAQKGLAQVQDPTAAAVITIARLQPGQSALDRCAGLGTKTLQIRRIIGDTGQLVALDPAEPRCDALRRLLQHRQITNVAVHTSSWLREIKDRADVPATFDRAIVDVPCSNSGVLARRPEARYHQSDRNLKSLAELQDNILDDTAPAVAPAGLLIYSTCSVWPEENQLRVKAFLKRHADFELIEDRSTLPSFDEDATRYSDGGYYAVFQKK